MARPIYLVHSSCYTSEYDASSVATAWCVFGLMGIWLPRILHTLLAPPVFTRDLLQLRAKSERWTYDVIDQRYVLLDALAAC